MDNIELMQLIKLETRRLEELVSTHLSVHNEGYNGTEYLTPNNSGDIKNLCLRIRKDLSELSKQVKGENQNE